MAQQAAQLISRQGEETRSAADRIAAFTVAARPEQLKPNVRQLLKRNILDNIACAIAALPGPPFKALREQFEEYRAPGCCTLIGGGKTSVDQAALFNSGLTRYPDGNLRSKVINTVQQLDSQPISALMDLLGQVRPMAVYPKTRAGI